MISRHNLVLLTLFRKTAQVLFAIDGYVRKVVKQASFHDTVQLTVSKIDIDQYLAES